MTAVSRVTPQVSLYASSLDSAVEEVFRLMLGIDCRPVAECPVEERQMISAVIGLAGSMSGICVLSSSEKVALRMAEILTGIETTTLDDTVKDAMGEICNMIAGAWKGNQPALASECMLSTPTVITGTNYQLHNQRAEFRIERFYCLEDSSFSVTVVCESIG
jgi:chemotaxis protein CheX